MIMLLSIVRGCLLDIYAIAFKCVLNAETKKMIALIIFKTKRLNCVFLKPVQFLNSFVSCLKARSGLFVSENVAIEHL